MLSFKPAVRNNILHPFEDGTAGVYGASSWTQSEGSWTDTSVNRNEQNQGKTAVLTWSPDFKLYIYIFKPCKI
jgi:hypothetical protein